MYLGWNVNLVTHFKEVPNCDGRGWQRKHATDRSPLWRSMSYTMFRATEACRSIYILVFKGRNIFALVYKIDVKLRTENVLCYALAAEDGLDRF